MIKNPYLSSLQTIWGNPQFVFVDGNKLVKIAKSMAGNIFPLPRWRIAGVFEENDLSAIKQMFYADCINFAFTNFRSPYEKFSIEYPTGNKLRGSLAMIACFRRAREEGLPIYDAEVLAHLTMETMGYIFRGRTELPLLKERMENLKLAAAILSDRYRDGKGRGNPLCIFNGSEMLAFNGGRGVVDRLVNDFGPVFSDASPHGPFGRKLQFYKRAQVFAMMYHGRAVSSGGKLKPLLDHVRLGPPADYVVPVALKSLGILRYEDKLEEKILRREIIEPNSPEEQEIRAQTVQAMVLLLEAVNAFLGPDRQISMLELDSAVWNLGRQCSEPHHLTPTAAY
jgi:hypothetical protein